jgi:hypothetical protein
LGFWDFGSLLRARKNINDFLGTSNNSPKPS